MSPHTFNFRFEVSNKSLPSTATSLARSLRTRAAFSSSSKTRSFSLHPIIRTHRERKRILKKGIGQSGQTEKKRRVNKDSTWWPSRVSVLEIYYILALLQRQVETLQTIGWTKQTTYNHIRLYLRTTFLQFTSLWTVHVRNVGCSPSPFLWSLGCRNLQVWCDMIF